VIGLVLITLSEILRAYFFRRILWF
jgi:hypothetical protein